MERLFFFIRPRFSSNFIGQSENSRDGANASKSKWECCENGRRSPHWENIGFYYKQQAGTSYKDILAGSMAMREK